ncbi:MAG: citrate (Si)-synthase [Sorangiineae bacterium NIC37A_2]|nr:MAG: citrate (Si)-synthase [Sorangiineae bacterium NIC37A_2]
MPNESLTITDNRTGKTYEIPIQDGTIRTMDLRQIRKDESDFGLMGYDPAFMNTASCRSAITFIDGDQGILRYRGYPVNELAEQATWMETAYLILKGELPTAAELEEWESSIKKHTFVHENLRDYLKGFRYDAHPMGVLVSTVGALSTFYPEAKEVLNPDLRRRQITRLIAKIPTLAAWAYRHSRGHPFVYPDPDLSYSANFLRMLKMNQSNYVPHPDVVRALDVLFILHADHEQNCSTNVMRSIGSSQADPYSAIAGSIAALYGPLHGGANEAVLRMLQQIGSKDKVPEFVKAVKDGSAGTRLMGFGHRVYKNYDPRAKVIKGLAEKVFAVVGRKNPLLDVALELERIALEDPYFVQRKLYPNVDFYSGLIYEALEIPVEMYTVMFAIPRTVGWLAQWEEMLTDKEQKIARPRQIYTGYDLRSYKPISSR